MHLGSLESTQEARVARGDSREQLLRFFRASEVSSELFVQVMYLASVAQWLEHWSCKPGVKSSNLFGGCVQLYQHFLSFLNSYILYLQCVRQFSFVTHFFLAFFFY